LPSKKGGKISFQAQVKNHRSPWPSITNRASINPQTQMKTQQQFRCAITRIVSISPLTNQRSCAGGNAVFSTSVIGTTHQNTYCYTFQWYKGSKPPCPGNQQHLVLTNVAATDAERTSLSPTGLYGSHLTTTPH